MNPENIEMGQKRKSLRFSWKLVEERVVVVLGIDIIIYLMHVLCFRSEKTRVSVGGFECG